MKIKPYNVAELRGISRYLFVRAEGIKKPHKREAMAGHARNVAAAADHIEILEMRLKAKK